MKRKGLILFVLIVNICFVACQGENITPTVDVNSQPPSEEVAENPAPNEDNDPQESATTVPEDIIEETGITAGASPTPPPPTFTPPPTATAPNTEEPENIDSEGDGSTESFTNVSINNGAYEGAILETQFGFGGGGGPSITCLTNNGLLAMNTQNVNTIEEFRNSGCILVDGYPILIDSYERPAILEARTEFAGIQFWNDNSKRHVLQDFGPNENLRILLYELNDGEYDDTGELVGWRDVQVNSNGLFLLKTDLPISSGRLINVAQRQTGELIAEGSNGVEAYFNEVVDSDSDGLTDEEELNIYYTDPNNQDSDGDGRSDGEEVLELNTDPRNAMNVNDVSVVRYEGNGQFVQQAGTAWVEFNNDGEFNYEETSRDPWSIYLYDPSRDLSIQLDLWTNEVICSGQDCNGVLYLIEGYSRGRACPFVFTYDDVAQNWTFDTTIIYKQVGPASEQPQWRKLQNFNGRLLIREIEPEISYLDQVYIVVVDQNGNETVLEHNFTPLQNADDNYFVMHKGDRLELNFQGYAAMEDVHEVWVVAEGYYEPLANHSP